MAAANRNQNRMRNSTPPWLVNEPLSTQGNSVRREWVEIAQKADANEGKARLAAAMLRMQSQRPVRPLLAQANTRTLRWVDTTIRRSREARRLQQASPDLSLFQRVLLRVNQSCTSIAAVLVLVCCKIGVFSALEGLSRATQRMAQLHIDRHIDPPVS